MRAVDVARAAVEAGFIVVPPASTQRVNEPATRGRLVAQALSIVELVLLVPSRRCSAAL